MSLRTARFSKPATWRVSAAAFLLLLPFAVTSQPPSAETNVARIDSLLDDLGRVRTPTSVTISPDGAIIAYAFNGSNGSELHLTPIASAGSADRALSPDTIRNVTNTVPGVCASSHPAWSPDGKQLAFLSGCTGSNGNWQSDSQDNIFVWTPATNDLKQVSRLHGAISDLQWSPDGKSIAFLFVENATRHAGALDAMKPWNGVYGEDGVEVQRIAVVDVSSGKFSQDDWEKTLHVYEFAWAPDSKGFIFTAAASPGENNWWAAKLYIHYYPFPTMCAGLCGPLVVFDPSRTTTALKGLQIAVPRFSPNGKRIAFIGGLMSDQGSTGGDIWVVNNWDISNKGTVPPGEPKDVTPDRPSTPAYIAWLDDHDLGISEHVGGSSRITALDLTTGEDVPGLASTFPETIMAGTDVMSVSIASRSRNIALIRESFDRPPEVWAGPSHDLKQITHLNDSIKAAWGRAESIEYSNEGYHIQGWLLYPAGWSPNDAANGKKYPLIVSVHGGPSSAVTPRWPGVSYGAVPFSALGYFVFMPNPRGSFGEGEKFTQANIKDFGYGDLRDILAGVDLIEKRFRIDKQREGITGWSYGGFMTMFAVTQTTRFKAAVAGAGISDWQSYYGENSIDQWMVPFFGASVYDDPAVYAKSSAIDFIKRVTTPTLMVVGDRDGECPAPQSFEFWHALRDLGVKTQLVIYPDEGHHFVSPAHQCDVLTRALDWFQAEMPPK